MDKHAKIYVTGHRGMVGSALVRRLQAGGYDNIVTRTREQLDLLDQQAVHRFLAQERPDFVFIAAAKVGGIQANNFYRADFIYQNLIATMLTLEMFPCCYMSSVPGHERVVLGASRGFMDYWNSAAFVTLRRRLANGPLYQACATCPAQG